MHSRQPNHHSPQKAVSLVASGDVCTLAGGGTHLQGQTGDVLTVPGKTQVTNTVG